MRPHSLWMIAGIVSAITAACIEIWTGSLIQQLTTSADSANQELVMQIVVTVFIVILAGVPAKYVMVFGMERSSALAIRDMRNDMIEHVGKLPVHVHEKGHTGDRVSRITNDMQLIHQFFVRDLAQWFYHPLLFIGCFAYLLSIQWKLVLFSLLLVPVSFFVAHLVGKQIQRLTEEAQHNMGQLSTVIQDTLGGIPTVKSYLLQGIMFKSFRDLLQVNLLKKLAMRRREAYINPILFTFMIAPIVFAVIYGSQLISKGLIGTGELIAFLYLLNLSIESLQEIPNLITNTFEMSGALKRISELAHEPTEEQERREMRMDEEAPPIQFEHVHFAYESSPPILRDLSFTVLEGQTVALVGGSGGGKSTVMKLLCGFYPLGEGSGGFINVYGQDIRTCSVSDLRARLSVVTQDSYLFSGTIADNIAFGRENATMDEVVEAAKFANAHSFIMNFPDGYQTEVGERGGLLSGGQRQRIAIARAFLKNAPILLLDEPTSALDTESEMLVQQSLNELMGKRTTIVIAHRLTTIEKADKILVMEQGTVVESGRHEELLQLNGAYARLYCQQFREDDKEEGVVVLA